MQVEINDLSYGYTKSTPLFRVSRLTLRKNSTTLILGPSGCGKSTLLNLCAGLIAPQSGNIRLNEMPPSTQLRQKLISYVYQDLNLVEEFSIRENLNLETSAIDQWRKYADLLQLSVSESAITSHLSFGERQRVAVIRSLLKPSEIILADEPTSHLDSGNAQKVMQAIVDSNRTVIVVSHDERFRNLFDQCFAFSDWTL